MYLITITYGCAYGEYSDYTTYPLMVVPDKETADLVVDECYNPNGMFRQKISEKLGCPEGIPDSMFDECGFSHDEIELYKIV